MFGERRQYKRVPLPQRIPIIRENGDFVEVDVENLSLGGLAIKTPLDFPCGENLIVRLDALSKNKYSHKPINIYCTVLHSQKIESSSNTNIVGIQFTPPN